MTILSLRKFKFLDNTKQYYKFLKIRTLSHYRNPLYVDEDRWHGGGGVQVLKYIRENLKNKIHETEDVEMSW